MQTLDETLLSTGELLILELGKEFIAQGHKASGQSLESLYIQLADIPNGRAVDLYGYKYLVFVDRGRQPGKWVPIDALLRWVQIKGFGSGDLKKETSIAWAINTNIRKFGIPTPGSLQFSSTGKRIDFIQDTLNRICDQVADEIAKAQLNYIMSRIDKAIA